VAESREPSARARGEPVEALPVVVLSKTFPARPSSIPDIREFVRHCLADSPLTDEDSREVSQTVFRALLDAAGPTGTIQVSFRIFPEHVEIDVLHSHDGPTGGPTLAQLAEAVTPPRPVGGSQPARPAQVAGPPQEEAGPPQEGATFAGWMAAALRREGLTHEAAAKQLGVSVKTVSRWVGGETEPRMRDLRRLQERFGDLPLA
jgi:hypothetical protein